MKILALNCGSSSVKYALLEMPEKVRLCHGIVDRVTVGKSFIKHSKGGLKDSIITDQECPTHTIAIDLVLKHISDRDIGGVSDLLEIKAVGHRVVHGGEKFKDCTLINEEVIRQVEECSSLAPLHNPANLAGIRAVIQFMPKTPQFAVFDTAFLSTMPPHVFTYGVPYEWYEKYHIRRYGFHGTSHSYVSKRAARLLSKDPSEINIITLHVGNGVSITAVKGGLAYDHSMGFTPLEGAVMGTRCGDIDPAIPLYVMGREALRCDEMEDILNRRSGLLGITGRYSDRREILKAMEEGDPRAKLSFDIECYRLKKYIGPYAAAMGGVDAIIFTAGAGENSFLHREKIMEGLEFMGAMIDQEKNRQAAREEKETEISTAASRVKVFVIPTDEELALAENVYSFMDGENKRITARQ
jgi:acetate kinase